jgi:transcriptional regulator with XRE-family HTH domain
MSIERLGYNSQENEQRTGMIRLHIEKIQEYARKKGLSQNALARRADMDVKTIQRLYKDPTAEFSSVTLGKLARALGLPSSELIEDIPDDPRQSEE